MNILLISMTPPFYNNSATLRTCSYISGLCKKGHTVDLVTPSYSEKDYAYDKSNEDFIATYINRYYTFERGGIYNSIGKKKDEKNGLFFSTIRRVVKKLYDLFQIYDSQAIVAKKAEKLDIDWNAYDVIISVSDPKSSHLIVKYLFERSKAPIKDKWIQCWGDPWYLDITSGSSIFKKYRIKKSEHNILRNAKKIIYTSPLTLTAQKKLFPDLQDRMFLVNQCCKEFRHELNTIRENSEIIGYFGAYNTQVRNLRPLYECCNEKNINLHIAGRSDKPLPNTKYCRVDDHLSYEEVEKEEDKCSILVCVCNLRGTQIPGKIYYNARYNKPIIVVLDGEHKDELKGYFDSFDRFILCENTKEDIYHAITKARDYNYKENGRIDVRLKDTYFAEVALDEK